MKRRRKSRRSGVSQDPYLQSQNSTTPAHRIKAGGYGAADLNFSSSSLIYRQISAGTKIKLSLLTTPPFRSDEIMGKKFRSRQKNRGSRSGCKINECQIITQDSDSEIVTLHSCQIITQDSDSEIAAQDSCQIITQDSDSKISDSEIVNRDPESLSFDCFNEDGILLLILSSLTLKEAVRTCVLSRRWKCIWTYLPKLIFDEENILDAETLELYKNFLTGKDKCYLLMGKTDYFIRSVDSVLQKHQGCVRVDEIHINYFLNKSHSHYIDAWVHFAVASKAKVLYLHLCQPHSRFRNIELYDFPLHLLPSSSIEELYLVACTLKPPYQSDFLNHLIVLAMWDVGDTGDDINHLVSLCSSSLKRLDVAGSKELESLSIPHSLSQLQTLTVEDCDRLTEIKVNAVNVDKIFYKGVPVDFIFRQPSCLVKANICFMAEGRDHNLNFYLTKLSRDLPYLRFLILKIDGVSKVENLPKCSSSFIHLKRLDWEWSVGVKMSHLHLDTLLDAAPFLEKLKLHLSTWRDEEPPPRLTKLRKKLPKHPHHHLKTIEISSFFFKRWQVEIVMYLLINATNLASMTLTLEKGPKKINQADMKSLAQQVPPNVRLVIL